MKKLQNNTYCMVQFPELQNSKTQNRTIRTVCVYMVLKYIQSGCSEGGVVSKRTPIHFILTTSVLSEFVKIDVVITLVIKSKYINYRLYKAILEPIFLVY